MLIVRGAPTHLARQRWIAHEMETWAKHGPNMSPVPSMRMRGWSIGQLALFGWLATVTSWWALYWTVAINGGTTGPRNHWRRRWSPPPTAPGTVKRRWGGRGWGSRLWCRAMGMQATWRCSCRGGSPCTLISNPHATVSAAHLHLFFNVNDPFLSL